MRVFENEKILRIDQGEDSVAVFDLPAASAARLVKIWLPHNCPIELISITSDAPLGTPGALDNPLWVHYGSSISHAEDAATPLEVWPVTVANQLGLDIYSLGLGGGANIEQFAARTIRDIRPDLISLKMGINVVNLADYTQKTFGPAVHGFIDTIREGNPTVPILVISPVCCPAHENNPGPTEMDANGTVAYQPFSRHAWIGELTLTGIRRILAELVSVRSQTDPNLYYMDGLELVDEIEAKAMPDGLHPDAAGYRKIAENFLQRYPREWLTR